MIGGYCARDLRTGQFSDAITNASMLSFLLMLAHLNSEEYGGTLSAHS